MPLRRKLLLAMLIPAVLLVIVGGIGISSLLRLERAAGRILSDNYHSIQETRQMEQALRYLGGRGAGELSGADRRALEAVTARFEKALGRCESNITESGETSILRDIRSRWDVIRVRVLVGAGKGAKVGAKDAMVERLYGDLDALIALNEKAMIEYERETRHVARMMLGAVAGTSLAAVIALIFFALVSAKRISLPVAKVADRLHEALNPDERSDDAQRGRDLDEIARLRQELDALLERLALYEEQQDRRLSHLQGRLAFVMNEVLEGLVLLDEEYRVLAINRVARTLLGSGNPEGSRLEDLVLREDVREVLRPLLSGEHRAERDLGEIRYAIDGDERVYRPRVLTVASAAGGVEGHLVLFWDVTEQRRFEESRRRFISMLSHQLKTPMTSLSMSVNLLREKLGDVTRDQSELLSIATENCNSLSALISDLIDAAREVTPDLTLQTRHVDIVRLLCSALRPLIPQSEEKEIELVMPAQGRAVPARVDPVKFPWVVTNIAGNALRYTGRGGRIDVQVTQSPREIEVSVRDTGEGMTAENVDRIFQPYVSLDEDPQPGTHGLGLAIAKEIVEAHGGSIEAESEPKVGTLFRIKLPV